MTFPTPWSVQHQPYTGLLMDGMNNEIPCWDDPVEVRVIGWSSLETETLGDYTSRQVVEGRLMTGPELAVKIRDRFKLPPRWPNDGMAGIFEVIEAKDLMHGPFTWPSGASGPGNYYKIRRTPETKQQALSHDC